MRRAEASATPQNARFSPWGNEPLFSRFSRPLPPFLRFNSSLNRVECSPPRKRQRQRKEGRHNTARGQSTDCGLGVDWHKKLRGKPPENLCATDGHAWTICPSSTIATPRLHPKKRTVHNPSLVHSFSTPLAFLSRGVKVAQGAELQSLVTERGRVLPGRKAPLLL